MTPDIDARYPIVEVQFDWLIRDEPMGSKDKHWIRRPGDAQPWLFKFSRAGGGQVNGEHWSEKVAAEVAAALGVAHAHVELARLDGHWGSLSRRFDALAVPGTALVHGNALLAGFFADYDPHERKKQPRHAVGNVLRAVAALYPADAAARDAALTMLAGYLVLDALVLNTDRHHQNWGVLRREDVTGGLAHEIAPSYDHASSLARNEAPDKLTAWLSERGRVARYARKAPGQLYWREGDAKGANPLQLAMDAARRWPAYFAPWRERLARMEAASLCRLMDRVPDEAIAAGSREFAKRLLAHTLETLKTF